MIQTHYKNVWIGVQQLISETAGVEVCKVASAADRDTAAMHYWKSQPLLHAHHCFKPLAADVDFGAIFRRRDDAGTPPAYVDPLRYYLGQLFFATARLAFHTDFDASDVEKEKHVKHPNLKYLRLKNTMGSANAAFGVPEPEDMPVTRILVADDHAWATNGDE